MKKVLSFALVLAVLVSAFAVSFVTTASADVAKEFVIDGNLDVWYLTNEETPTNDYNYYHLDYLEAYNLDPTNGHGMYFFDGAETSAEVYVGYDDTYVYVYVKCWDDDIAINPEDERGSSQSDSLEIWFDPDPNSQTTHPNGTPKTESEIKDWPTNTCDPEQGDVRFRMRAADFKISDIHPCVKGNYGGVQTTDFYMSRENVMPFYFENEPREVANGDIVSSGFGVEARFPRFDVTGGNAFRVAVACNNRLEDDEAEWYALATGQAWWLDYSTANQVLYTKDGSLPCFKQDVTGQTMYYTDNEYNAAGMAVRDAIDELPATITVLEKGQVQDIVNQYNALDDVQKGYVQARNFSVLKAAADKLGVALDGPAGDPIDPPVDDPVDPPVDDPVDPPVDVTLGDVNNDSKIDAKDALLVLRISVNKYTPTEAEKVAADVNVDENINARDALEILKYSVDKPSCLSK